MKKDNPFLLPGSKVYLYLFLAIWLGVNIVQSFWTGLFNDEAYYVFYSLHPAWGYYDHPPLIAFVIKAGYTLFHNELGVRLMIILLSTLGILVLIKLGDIRNYPLFFSLFFSVLILQITGFLAVPDSILFFLTILFFSVYRTFLQRKDMLSAILLGITMTLLLYCKYLGALVIFFTILSNLRIFRYLRFWLAALTGLMLYLPHLYWQYSHQFISIYYHFMERSHDEMFRLTNLTDYLGGQVAMMNPLLFVVILYFLIIFRPENRFDRALQFNAIGILCLPLLLALKGRVESNWSLTAYVPVILISYRMLQDRNRLKRYVYAVGLFSVLLVLAIRVLLIENYLPEKLSRHIHLETHGWKEWSRQVSRIAEGRPVVFMGSYQAPSKYIFYSGNEAFTFNTWNYRGNQFDLENIEQRLQGEEVVVFFERKAVNKEELQVYGIGMTDSLMMMNGKYHYFYKTKNYRSFNFIPIGVEIHGGEQFPGSVVHVEAAIKNPDREPVHFAGDGAGKVMLAYSLFKHGKVVQEEKFMDISDLVLSGVQTVSFPLNMPEQHGTYYLRLALKTDWMPLGINSRFLKIKVSNQ